MSGKTEHGAGVEVVAAQEAQRRAAKRATLEGLRGKRRAEKEFSLVLNEGEDPVSFLFRSIGAQAYDRLITKCPPTKEQQADGGAYDQNRFAPLLLAAVCVEPVLDEAEWREIWESPDWNRGEVMALFWAAVELCNKGLELNPIVAG